MYLSWPLFKCSQLKNYLSKSPQTCYTASVHQYVSENVIKIFGDFEAIFWKKPWTIIVQAFFPKFGVFKKWS